MQSQEEKKEPSKFDPYSFEGKWEGKGTMMEGENPIDYCERSEFKVISSDPDTVMKYQQKI